jgi:hypothetical protein
MIRLTRQSDNRDQLGVLRIRPLRSTSKSTRIDVISKSPN